MIFRHLRKLRSDLHLMEMLSSEKVGAQQSGKRDWEKVAAIGTVISATATVVAAFAGVAAVGVYIYQAGIAEKGLSEPIRVAILQKLDSICADFDRVYPGIVIEGSKHGTILVKESLSDMPLDEFKIFQKRIQDKAQPLSGDAHIYAGSRDSKERQAYLGLAGELERYSFERTGIPERYKDGQIWIATFRRDCRDTWYQLSGVFGDALDNREYPGTARVLSIEEIRQVDPSMADEFQGRQFPLHPAFPPDLVTKVETPGGS